MDDDGEPKTNAPLPFPALLPSDEVALPKTPKQPSVLAAGELPKPPKPDVDAEDDGEAAAEEPAAAKPPAPPVAARYT